MVLSVMRTINKSTKNVRYYREKHEAYLSKWVRISKVKYDDIDSHKTHSCSYHTHTKQKHIFNIPI